MGPGLLIKLLLGGSFSLMVFGWAQILMDLQPLLVMITGAGHLHGFSHTWLGALLIGVICMISGVMLLRWLESWMRLPGLPSGLAGWGIALFSSLVGTFSHVMLDGMIYFDMHPSIPWSEENPLLGWVDQSMLYQICFFSGLMGLVLWFLVCGYLHRRGSRASGKRLKECRAVLEAWQRNVR